MIEIVLTQPTLSSRTWSTGPPLDSALS